MSRSVRNWILLFVVIGVTIAIDQLTKHAVINALEVREAYEPIPALGAVFQITRSENTGAAFGFLPDSGVLFLVIAVLVVMAMLYYYPRIPYDATLTRIAIGLICGGALGNALDRVQHGLVVDFIHYSIPGIISNVSNLADHAIVFGVIVMFFDSWRRERAQKQAAKIEAASDTSNIVESIDFEPPSRQEHKE
ncbi:MAG: signal peptidase II [Burkholderiales bacterium]|nr:signal peptidase II [Anaerolineae bacterium]